MSRLTQPKKFQIWIGYDSREPIAAHVCAHSIIRRASHPVQIGFLHLASLNAYYKRDDKEGSTEFSLTRFLTPYLSNNGISMFVDGDFVFLADVWELYDLMEGYMYSDVACCQHDYTPRQPVKFLGHRQDTYPRKNWSSLMLFNGHRRAVQDLTPTSISMHSPAYLHRMEWARDIAPIPLAWNWLVGEYDAVPVEMVKALHFTCGLPVFKGYETCDYADVWRAELAHMQTCAEG